MPATQKQVEDELIRLALVKARTSDKVDIMDAAQVILLDRINEQLKKFGRRLNSIDAAVGIE